MKKIMMTLAAVCVAATMNAQYYVGGSLGYTSNKTNNGTIGVAATQETTTNVFAIAPEFGMSIDDKLGFGIVFGFGTGKTTVDYVGTAAGTPSVSAKNSTVDIKPYLRYQVLTFGKANIFVDGGVDLGFSKTEDMKPAMDLGLFVTPGVAFDVNDKWSIVAKLNDMFAFGYHKDAVADVDGAPDPATRINANLSTGGFNVGSLTFGVYYKF